MEYLDSVNQLARHDAILADTVRIWSSLEDVIGWMRLHKLPLRCIERVVMDEYNHDVVVPHPDATRWLVFGCT